MKTKKKKWEKPQLVILTKGNLGENVLYYCGFTNPDGSTEPRNSSTS